MEGLPAILTLGAVVAGVAILAVVGAVSWGRTLPVRHPRGPSVAALESSMDGRTSSLTFVPGLAGLLLGASALLGASSEIIRGRSPPLGWVFVGVAGLLVAVLGLGARVASLHIDDQGLRVEYGRLRPFSLRWEECVRLAPPRWPMGAWRVSGRVGHRDAACRLMPTDLLGHEFVLGVVAARAGLAFDGRAWNAPARTVPT